jgi:signal transduction histidine kinase
VKHALLVRNSGCMDMDVDALPVAATPSSQRSARSLRLWGLANLRALSTFAAFVVTFAFSFGDEQPGMMLASNVLLSGLAAAMVWLCFDHAVAALCAVAVMCLGSPAFSPSFAALELVVVFVLFQVVARSDLDPRVVAVVGFVSLTANDLWLRRVTDASLASPTVLYPVVLTFLAVGLGLQARRLRRQHLELVALQHADRERAVLSERQRIARDLHDVAAHHLSALVVQNKLARRISTVEALEEAADFSAQTARDALDALRQVVGVLGSDSPLEPQPGLSDLEPMFDRLKTAGLVVHRSFHPSFTYRVSDLRRDVELAIVRISQEALTNVLRHRGPGQAWVELIASENQVHLRIEDDGPRFASARNETERGYGLINMAERAKSTGGSLVIGDSPRGGWSVEAKLPIGGEP